MFFLIVECNLTSFLFCRSAEEVLMVPRNRHMLFTSKMFLDIINKILTLYLPKSIYFSGTYSFYDIQSVFFIRRQDWKDGDQTLDM